jgi:hypothetical protein
MLDLPAILTKLATRHSKEFVYRDEVISLEQVFALNGGLPILVKRANLLADFLFGRKLEVALVSDPAALTGERVNIMPEQSLFVLAMLLYDVLEELVVTTTGHQINLT